MSCLFIILALKIPKLYEMVNHFKWCETTRKKDGARFNDPLNDNDSSVLKALIVKRYHILHWPGKAVLKAKGEVAGWRGTFSALDGTKCKFSSYLNRT